jgi:hypothetical protein
MRAADGINRIRNLQIWIILSLLEIAGLICWFKRRLSLSWFWVQLRVGQIELGGVPSNTVLEDVWSYNVSLQSQC